MDVLAQLQRALADRYAIEGEIGRGGMATVYVARDLKHGRKVALKVLDAELGLLVAVERFLAEIRVTANLQHPNVLPLFDSGDADGVLYYVMPYVEGESLRSKLAREKQLAVPEAVRIASAIAGALDYAHRNGIIHRDLKPENILLRDGQPLLADFGIALALSVAGGDRITKSGISVGTPQYSSPEQATGDRNLDARTDVYSLGAVTYEMLTGEPPYSGTTTQAIIARVLTDTVRDIRATRPTVPAHVNAAVLRALEKVPADRWQSAHDFAEALTQSPFDATTSLSLSETRHGQGRARHLLRRSAPWLVIGALGVAAGAFLPFGRRAEPFLPVGRFHITLPESISVHGSSWTWTVAVSPDGSRLAYLGQDNAIYIRPLDEFASRVLPGTEGAQCPSFSPEGNWLVYGASDGYLRKVSITGGAPVVLSDTSRAQKQLGPDTCGSWLDREQIVFGYAGALFKVSANGGRPSLVARPAGEEYYYNPRALPGGKFLLVTVGGTTRGASTELGVVNVSDGRLTKLGVEGSDGQYVSSGHIVFVVRSGTIVAAPFSLQRLRVTGPAVSIAKDAMLNPWADGSLSASDQGTLVYLTGEPSSARLVAVDSRGKQRVLSTRIGAASRPRVSPDGRHVALQVGGSAYEWDVWIYDLSSQALTRLTSNSFSFRPAGWTPDGRSVIYVAPESASFTSARRIVTQAWDRSSEARELFRMKGEIQAASEGPAHTYLAASVTTRRNLELWIAPLDTPSAARPFTASETAVAEPAVSPNGKWLAYSSNETGTREVYVRALPGPGGALQVSAGGGTEPVWDSRSQHLYYRSPRRIVRATIETEPQLRLAGRDTLFEDLYDRTDNAANFDVLPGTGELLMLRTDARARVAIVVNWPALLRPSGRVE